MVDYCLNLSLPISSDLRLVLVAPFWFLPSSHEKEKSMMLIHGGKEVTQQRWATVFCNHPLRSQPTYLVIFVKLF